MLVAGGLGTAWYLTRPDEKQELIGAILQLWQQQAASIGKSFNPQRARIMLQRLETGNLKLLHEWSEAFVSKNDAKANELFPALERTVILDLMEYRDELPQYKGIFFQ